MNRKYISFIATLVMAIFFSQFLPWWSIMLAAFLSELIFSLKRMAIFYVPFLSVAIYWAVYAFILSSSNDFILAEKIAVLLPLGGSPYVLILVTAIIGGFAAGAAGTFAHQVRYILK